MSSSVVQAVGSADREEFINVGVILYCPRLKFLELAWSLDSSRLRALCPAVDMEELEIHLRAFGEITRGSKDGGPIGQLDIASRFRSTESGISDSGELPTPVTGDRGWFCVVVEGICLRPC